MPPQTPNADAFFDFGAAAPLPAGWSNGAAGSYPFTRGSGSTPSWRTGPSAGPAGAASYYYYAETSSPRRVGDRFALAYDGSACTSGLVDRITFAYHMYGSGLGTLEVRDDHGLLLWQRSGNKGNVWYSGSVTVSSWAFAFAYTRGTHWQGDAAIGHVRVHCTAALSSPPAAPPAVPPPVLDTLDPQDVLWTQIATLPPLMATSHHGDFLASCKAVCTAHAATGCTGFVDTICTITGAAPGRCCTFQTAGIHDYFTTSTGSIAADSAAGGTSTNSETAYVRNTVATTIAMQGSSSYQREDREDVDEVDSPLPIQGAVHHHSRDDDAPDDDDDSARAPRDEVARTVGYAMLGGVGAAALGLGIAMGIGMHVFAIARHSQPTIVVKSTAVKPSPPQAEMAKAEDAPPGLTHQIYSSHV